MDITVTPELEDFVADEVASGRFGSPSEVIMAGLEALQAEEQGLEQWLIDEVVPALEELESNPSLGIPIDVAFAEIREQRSRRIKARA